VESDLQVQPVAEDQGAWARPLSARLGEAMVALALLASALFFVGFAAGLPFGTVGLPGPAFFPFALGVALGTLALAILLLVRRMADAGERTFLGHRNVLVAIAALIGVAIAFEWADTYLTLGVFAAVMLLVVARAGPWRAALGASLGMVAVWAVFNRALGVRLPVGEFWQSVTDLLAALPLSAPF
jgi:hypothetical protein